MEFRKSELKDLPAIMAILKAAQQYFKEMGIDQWQDGYPDVQTIRQDIEQGISWVMTDAGVIMATAVISFQGDENYKVMEEGRWLTKQSYAVIHRIAVLPKRKGQGLAGQFLNFAEELCRKHQIRSVRIDTHADNRPMRRLIEKSGFQYCGVIRLRRDQALRVAYEKEVY